jgi:hypothetical protein
MRRPAQKSTDDYTVFKTNLISTVTEVRLYQDTVEKIKDRHPEVPIELPSIMEAVGKAVISPTHIEQSHSGTYVYVDRESTNAAGDPLRVPVKPVIGTSCRVQSAYFASTSASPTIIWRKA